MKINPITNLKIQNYSQAKPTNYIKQNKIGDTVCFSAKSQNDNVSNNIKKAVEFFSKIISYDEINSSNFQELVKEYSPEVDVKPMSNLNIPNAKNYAAFYSAHINEDFTPSEQTLYIDVAKGKGKDRNERFAFACDSAHEFTHAMQMQKGNSIEQLKKLSNGNYQYAKLIMAVGDAIFSVFDNEIQANAILPTFRNIFDITNVQRYGTVLPRENNINPTTINTSLGANSEKQFNEKINQIFDGLFLEIIKNNINDELFSSSLPKDEDLNSIKRKIKKYCAIKAAEEKEAYTSEVKVAKKYLNTTKTLNIEIRPIYYEKLEKAFK